MFQRNNDTRSNNGKSNGKKVEGILRKNPPTIISGDVHMLGNIISEGAIDIDGCIEGNVTCKSVTIRKNGVIKGDVSAEELHVYGRVEGVLKAKETNLYASCHVEGVIIHESLTIEDGAFVDGQFKRSDKINSEADMLSFDDEDDIFRQLKLVSDPTPA